MNNWVQFLLSVYDHGGYLPDASVGNAYSDMMIGSPETPMIVGAYMKGIRKYDIKKAYSAIIKQHTVDGVPYYQKDGIARYKGIPNIELYRSKGSVPYSASQTLEYCYQDWCVAQMALAMNRPDEAQIFTAGAHNYRNVWDAQTSFMRYRNADGTFPAKFNPFSINGFTEATAWQYLWFVPHDVQGLINLMGGDARFCETLDYVFKKSRKANFSMDALATKADCYLNYGNEPDMQPAHLFNYAGMPWLTQYWAREVLDYTYGLRPHDGYLGDEDQGQLGSWFVFVAMGLFHVNGGAPLEPFYDLSSPLFDRIVIHLDHRYYEGKTFTIRTMNNSSWNRYIQRAKLNGMPLNQCWVYHKDIVKGGELVLEMGPSPNTSWTASGPRPPSMTKAGV